MYLSYLPNLRAQFSFYPAKCYNFKECVSFNAKPQQYYIIVVKCLFIPYRNINAHIWIDQRYYKQYKAIAPSVINTVC